MRSFLTSEFRKLFKRLPKAVQESTRKSYRLWKDNPEHPSLHFKRLQTKSAIYSVRVAKGWRALGLRQRGRITWYWIGSHADYDAMI